MLYRVVTFKDGTRLHASSWRDDQLVIEAACVGLERTRAAFGCGMTHLVETSAGYTYYPTIASINAIFNQTPT